MRVAVGSDEETPLLEAISRHLAASGHEPIRVGAGLEWPEVGRLVGEAVAEGDCERGIACCWTGTGVSIAANKVVGVRAALCPDAPTAAGARRYNDANVLALSLRLTTATLAAEIVDAFFSEEVGDSEQEAIDRIETDR